MPSLFTLHIRYRSAHNKICVSSFFRSVALWEWIVVSGWWAMLRLAAQVPHNNAQWRCRCRAWTCSRKSEFQSDFNARKPTVYKSLRESRLPQGRVLFLLEKEAVYDRPPKVPPLQSQLRAFYAIKRGPIHLHE